MNMSYPQPSFLDERLRDIEAQIKEIQNFIQIVHTKINQRGLCQQAKEWGWQVVSGGKDTYKAVRSGWATVPILGHGKKNLAKKGTALGVLKDLAEPVLGELEQEFLDVKQQLKEQELAKLQIYVDALEKEIIFKKNEVTQLVDELIKAEEDTEVSLEFAAEVEHRNLALVKENENLNRSLTDLMKERVELERLKHKVGQLMKERRILDQKMRFFVTQYEASIQWLRNFASKLPFGLGQELLNHLNILESGNLGISGSEG
ncbi:hypothetical protein L3556_13525 [Candidatus Synechococcus calcipolaris G9]|uniref:Uncharacterized protein n=1 Tax=Candidatus Synechococcus calcipolaris G9 TaxID=1497997 RepID=A0ABT6F259_9SYNE|nr:hypothetical protein [Candidatus Synechococcus calcipolaris]MDG2991944.1 hypothetical protein [Candidatus Synechococcus calcipolaris G9]